MKQSIYSFAGTAKKLKASLPDRFRFDEKKHAYFLNDKPMMGCTSVLGVIAKPALIGWASKMACEHIRDTGIEKTIDGIHYILTQGHLIEEAKNAHRKKKEAAGESGTDLHALAEGYIRLCIDSNDGKPHAVCPAGLEQFRDWAITHSVKFLATEKRMYSKTWWIAGTADIIFEKDGKKYIGDIKTYKKIWDRVPFFQCAGYANMYEEMTGGKETISGYCVLRLSKDGSFEEKWSFDIEGDTKAFFACVELYRQLQNYTT